MALRLPPANGCDPFGIEEGEEDDLSDRGYAERWWRCAYRDPVVALRLKKRGDSPWVFVSPGEKSDENC